MDHTDRHLSSGLEIDKAEDIFCDPTPPYHYIIILGLMMIWSKLLVVDPNRAPTSVWQDIVSTCCLQVQDDTRLSLSIRQ